MPSYLVRSNTRTDENRRIPKVRSCHGYSILPIVFFCPVMLIGGFLPRIAGIATKTPWDSCHSWLIFRPATATWPGARWAVWYIPPDQRGKPPDRHSTGTSPIAPTAPARRRNPRTCQPRAAAARAICPPMKPVAPMTRHMVIVTLQAYRIKPIGLSYCKAGGLSIFIGQPCAGPPGKEPGLTQPISAVERTD